MDEADFSVLGTTTRGLELQVPVTLSRSDRRRHLHVIGKTGTGKSTLLFNLMLEDLASGAGFALLDPHGDLAEAVIDAVPPARTNDVIYLNPADPAHVVGLNPLAHVQPDARPLAAAHLVAAFSHIWGLSPEATPRLLYILNAALRLLLDTSGTTLVLLPRLLIDDDFRARLLRRCRDPIIRAFWTEEFVRYHDRFAIEAVAPLQNKIGLLLSEPAIRHTVGQVRSTIHIDRIMNHGRVLIANLSKGKLGAHPSHLIGAMLTTAFAQAAESRAIIPEAERRDFTLYADEFQNFATESFASVLSEARKWRLSLCTAHQHLGQLPLALRQAILGNAGSLVVFRVSAEDSAALAAELGIQSASALTDTPNFSAWVKLLCDGVPREAMFLDMLFPEPAHAGRGQAVISRSRARHTRPRAVVERTVDRQLDIDPHHQATRA